ncbi:MAG: TetR/AcrR family transcriptional regulator [Aliishimia sp.]
MTAHANTDSERQTETMDRILTAAELEFAERGFDGVGMKAISVRAGVSQGLLHYHFGTKDRLYEEVIGRRSTKINEERRALLSRVDFTREDALDHVLEAMFRPPLGPSGGEAAYARIFSGLIIGREREQALVKKFYDPTARLFVDAFGKILHAQDPSTAGLCYVMSLGVLVSFIGRDGRVESLMNRADEMETEERLSNLILFARGGVEAILDRSVKEAATS